MEANLLQTAAHNEHLDLVIKLALATLPMVMIVGFATKDIIEGNLRTLSVIATTTILFAVVLWIADRRPGSRSLASWSDTVWIGLTNVGLGARHITFRYHDRRCAAGGP